MWQVRLTVLQQLTHWRLRCQDAWTIEPPLPVSQQVTAGVARIQAARQRMQY